jgi:hypothetical protein
VVKTGGLPARQEGLRQHNLALVAQSIAAGEPVSRAGIAAATGLTKTTVSSLVDDLVGAGLVSELGPEASGKIGRPGSALALNRTGFVGVGLEINVDYLAVCVANLVGEVRTLRTRPRDNRGQSPAKVLGRALRMTNGAIASAQAAGLTVAGLAVAVPGPVETGRGLLRLPPTWAGRRCPWPRSWPAGWPPGICRCWSTTRPTWPPLASCGSAATTALTTSSTSRARSGSAPAS